MWSELKGLVNETLVRLWERGFRLAGLVRRPSASRWNTGGGQRVLVVAPHPDDEVAGCGGTLLLHSMRRDAVHLVYVTDGSRSRALGLRREDIAARRRAEAMACAQALGKSTVHWLGFPEGDWSEGELARALRGLLLDVAPHVIYGPSRVDFHPEHQRVARCLATVLSGAGSWHGAIIRVYQVQVPLTGILTNVVAPVAQVESEVRRVFECHASQLGSLRRCLRMRRYAGCFHGIRGIVEEFWEMRTAAYCRLHGQDPAVPIPSAYRGLRAFPLSDPLAYAWGRGTRRRWMAVVRDGS